MEQDYCSSRHPASWLTVALPDGFIAYYQLDEFGDLITYNGVILPHHFVDARFKNCLYCPSDCIYYGNCRKLSASG
jgi:hypothetical protein